MFIVLLYLLWLVVKFYLKKKTDLIGFFKIKPRHPDEQKKQIWVEKPAMGAL